MTVYYRHCHQRGAALRYFYSYGFRNRIKSLRCFSNRCGKQLAEYRSCIDELAGRAGHVLRIGQLWCMQRWLNDELHHAAQLSSTLQLLSPSNAVRPGSRDAMTSSNTREIPRRATCVLRCSVHVVNSPDLVTVIIRRRVIGAYLCWSADRAV